ncbi:MAG: hypothetical protein KIH69_022255 [Anaerolineae bacterium]|nr:hypothetical protein [Anaerolineae bacterium]
MNARFYRSAHGFSVVFVLSSLILITFVTRLAQPNKIVDDAYITLRYASNLANGAGLVFNPGEWVLGTTAPLHAIVLAGLRRLLPSALSLTHIVVGVNALYDAISVIAIALTFAHLSRSWVLGLCSAASLAVLPALVDYASAGMETSLYVMLIWLTTLLVARQRLAWAGITAVLAALTRPEAIALIALVGLVVLFSGNGSRRNQLLSAFDTLLPALTIIAGWLAITTYAYGSPLPQSAATKLGGRVYELAGDETYWMVLQTQRNLVPWLTFEAKNKPDAWLAGLPTLGLWLTGAALLMWRNWRPGILAAFTLIFAVGVSLSNPVPNWWHLATLSALAFPVVVAGAGGLLRMGYLPLRLAMLTRHRRIRQLIQGGLWLIVSSATLAATGYLIQPHLNRYNLQRVAWPQLPLSALQLKPSYDAQRERDYGIVAETLSQMQVGNARVAAPEIGAFGYAYDGPILDSIGLVSPVAARHYPIPKDELLTNNAVPRQLVQHEQPEFVMSLDVFIANSLLKDAAFTSRYQPVMRGKSDIFGSHSLLLFARHDFADRWRIDKLDMVAQFGDSIRLHDTFVEPRSAYGGNRVNIGLLWSGKAMPNDYKVFVHAFDADGKRVAQSDAPPDPPLALWAQNVVYLDWHSLELPTDLDLHRAHFIVGLYHASTGQRLPISHADRSQVVEGGLMIRD